jgi:hypothetical protein
VLGGVDHVGIKLGGKVVIGVLCNIMPFSLRLFSAHLESMTECSFGDSKRVMAIGDILIDTKVWNEVVDVISSWLLLVLVLTTTSG